VELARSTQPVRTSQPPPGDFRRLFEFLLSHHAEVVYVGLSRAVSGTLQSAERAAQETDPKRVRIVDTRNGSGGQGSSGRARGRACACRRRRSAIAAELATLAQQTQTFAYARDLSNAVRGRRIPRWALADHSVAAPVPVIRLGGGGWASACRGVMRDRGDLPARFVARVVLAVDHNRALARRSAALRQRRGGASACAARCNDAAGSRVCPIARRRQRDRLRMPVPAPS
jgi:hypothetical protein